MEAKLKFLTEKQAMELLGKGKTWFHEMKKKHGLKHYKPKGTATVWYKLEELNEFIENGAAN
jgi:hypothetical protein